MMTRTTCLAVALTALISGGAFAQSNPTQSHTERDVDQQQRIEQGLKSGELTSHEAGALERQDAHINQMEAHDLKDGSISPAEQARLKAAQNHVSKDIYAQKHDAQLGNPDSKSSERMQADVQRNVNQEKRIYAGEKSGQLNNEQVGRLEHGQARDDRRQSNAAAYGGVGRREQRGIQRSDNRQSRRIYRVRH